MRILFKSATPGCHRMIEQYEKLLTKEAEAFDQQSTERMQHGFVPDLRRLTKMSWFYNNIWRDPEFVKIYLMPKVNFVIDYVSQNGGNVLELGCGNGYLALELARNGLHVVGVDLSPVSIEIAKKCAQENTFTENFGSLQYCCADIMSMDFEENSFDSIVFFSTLHHMPDINVLFPKIYSALKNGGKLIIVEPVRGEFSKKSAELAALLRLVLPTYNTYEDKQRLLEDKTWAGFVKDIFDEYTFEGEHEQSPHDNLTNTADMILKAVKKHFKVKKVLYSGAFLEKMIGALRGENKYILANFLKFIDDKLVDEKILPFTNIQLLAVKE